MDSPATGCCSELNEGKRPAESGLAIAAMIAGGQILLHVLTNGNYGIFRDELYYLDCARHLDYGYVDHPPLSIWLLAAARAALGDSLQAIRLLSELAGGALVVLTALLAKELGGGRLAQAVAALATALTPAALALTGYFSMNAFDLVFWALLFCIVARLSAHNSPGLWLWFGLVAGLGLLNKISVLFLGTGVFAALLLTPLRRYLLGWQVYAGAALALALFLPYLLWNVAHEWPTLEFIANAKRLKIAPLGPVEFLGEQLLGMSLLLAPLWIAGLVWLFVPGWGGRFRALGVCFLSVLMLFMVMKGKAYYVFPAYAPLFAAGSCAVERLARGQRRRRWVAPAAFVWIGLAGALALPIGVPLLTPEGLLRYQAAWRVKPAPADRIPTGEMLPHFADRFGWENLTASVASVYAALPEHEKTRCVIVGTNYGRAGAINYFGGRYGLPRAISGHNNHYLWGTGSTDPLVVIHIGGSAEALSSFFEEVRVVARTHSPYAMPYENNVPVHLCRGLKVPWADAWLAARRFI